MATRSGEPSKSTYGTKGADALDQSDKTLDAFAGLDDGALLENVRETDRKKETASGQSGDSGSSSLLIGQPVSFFSPEDPLVDMMLAQRNLTGTDEDDTLSGTKENNRIEALAGNDILAGKGGADTLLGGAGEDTISGGTDDDLIEGGSGNDIVAGDEGDDTLVGGDGNDILAGGDGDDLLIGNKGYDTLDGGGGSDTVSYADLRINEITDFITGVHINLEEGTGKFFAAGDVFIGIENVIGTKYHDRIEGDDQDNRLEGGDGDDRLLGNAGDDTLIGGNGDDNFTGSEGADIMDGGQGSDIVNYHESNAAITIDLRTGDHTGGHAEGDTLIDVELILGSDFGDLFIGNAEDNYLGGGAGEDTLIGGAGNDYLGGSWTWLDDGVRDTFVFQDRRGEETDMIIDFKPGIDVIDLTGTEINNYNDLFTEGDRYMEQIDSDTVIHYYDHDIILFGIEMGSLSESDFLF